MPIIISILIIPVSPVIRISQNFGPPINAPERSNCFPRTWLPLFSAIRKTSGQCATRTLLYIVWDRFRL